jgi:predicted metal-dependent enzyme (double-stranded beta helix superfamily)
MPQIPYQLVSPSGAGDRRAVTIGTLAAEISLACGAADEMASRVRSALERAVSDPELLIPEQRETCAAGYARHVIYSDPLGRFTILAIVWGERQFSPSHAHDTWCAYAVYENPLQETVYAIEPQQTKARPVCTKVRNPGYSCFAGAGLDQIHRLGNSGTTPAISIHVYGVPRDRVGTHVNKVLETEDEKDLSLEQDDESFGAAEARQPRRP